MAEIPLIMPKMSMTMEEGTVVAWHKEAGDSVRQGEVVAEVLTDKVDMEVEATHDGVLSRIVAQVDDVVKVGDPIGYIESEQEDLLGDLFADVPVAAVEETPKAPAATEVAAVAPAAVSAETPVPNVSSNGIIAASPLARKLAKDANLDLSQIAPSGPHNTIRVADVRAAIESGTGQTVAPVSAPAAQATATQSAPAAPKVAAPVVSGELFGDSAFQRSRKAVARSMQPSAEVPQFTAYRSLDLEAMALARKTSLKGIGWTSILVRALALALRQYPQMNSFWTDKGVIANENIGVTLAVDTEHGLMVPVLLNPDQKTLSALNAELADVVEQARNKRMDIEALKKATTTVSNMGGLGVDRFNALITPPQATALSMGAIQHVPVLNDAGHFEPKLVIQVGLTVDHRVGDGADAARLLQALADYLSDPIKFLA
ncbi:MAG: dihydrolipoamide acetyltransferase family protein [Microbacteriaceae bacterium]